MTRAVLALLRYVPSPSSASLREIRARLAVGEALTVLVMELMCVTVTQLLKSLESSQAVGADATPSSWLAQPVKLLTARPRRPCASASEERHDHEYLATAPYTCNKDRHRWKA